MASWSLDRALVTRLHKAARADRWALPLELFEAALEASTRKAFTDLPDRRQIETYLESLHLEDLALACACAEGSDSAWEHVIREYRPALYRAADAIDPGGGARDLADSLYAELFGLSERDGERRSHFRYFHGRSSLATWLRAVLAQRHVDRIRSQRRLESLPDDDAASAIAAGSADVDPARSRYLVIMQCAITAAVAALAPRDRLRLACYYSQDLTLAQIGRALGEHEATASRHLARTRREIRATVEHELALRERMSESQIADCFASVLDDPGALDITDLLTGGSEDRTGGSEDPPLRPGADSSRKETGHGRSRHKETSRAGGT